MKLKILLDVYGQAIQISSRNIYMQRALNTIAVVSSTDRACMPDKYLLSCTIDGG